MADISILSRLVSGVQRNVDVSQNTLIVGSLKVGTTSPTELTKTILNNLLALQNGSDFATGTNAHTHDGRYYTETELGAQTDGASGASKIGIDVTPAFSNFTSGSNVQSALEGIDTALAAATGTKVKISATDTTSSFLDAAITAGAGLSKSITNPSADEVLDLAVNVDGSSIEISTDALRVKALGITSAMLAGSIDATKIADGSVTSTEFQYINSLTSNAQTQLDAKLALAGGTMSGAIAMGGNKVTGLGAPTANGDALRFDQLGAVSGIATLDAGGKVPVSQLPNSVMTFEGIWDASTNTPALADATGNAGMVYLVTVAGTQNLGSGSQTFAVGDWVVANSSVVWQKSINSNAVVSVNGATGVVTVNAINQLTGDVTASAASGSESKATTIAAGAVTGSKIAADTITNTNINSAAAIAYSKLNLSASIVNADVAAGAAIAYSKLALTNSIVAGDITSDAITTVKILDANVTAGKLASDSVTTIKILDANVTLAKLASLSVDENKLTASVAGAGLTGGAGSALAVGANADGSIVANANDIQVAHAPAVKATGEIAGEAFSTVTLYAVRYAQDAETAGRIYKADKDATSVDNFHVIGLVKTAGALIAADTVPAITKAGLITATAHGFTVGKPVFLSASGALTSTAPSAANEATVIVGMVKDTNTLDVRIQVMGVN